MKPNLEVCVDSVESALNAQAGGADRLEVCSNLIIGGTTPGVSQFKQIRDICEIELRVLIRPRFGDFLYTDAEFQMMKEDILMFGELGADGIAVGCLKADGSMDMEQMRALRECAGPMKLTMHRAFDVCRDPYEALEEAVGLGIDTILTSGQAAVCTVLWSSIFVTRMANKINFQVMKQSAPDKVCGIHYSCADEHGYM